MCTLKAATEPLGFPKEQKPREIAAPLGNSHSCSSVNARPFVIAAVSSRAEKRNSTIATNIDTLSPRYTCRVRRQIRRRSIGPRANSRRESSVGNPNRRPVSKCRRSVPRFHAVDVVTRPVDASVLLCTRDAWHSRSYATLYANYIRNAYVWRSLCRA